MGDYFPDYPIWFGWLMLFLIWFGAISSVSCVIYVTYWAFHHVRIMP